MFFAIEKAGTMTKKKKNELKELIRKTVYGSPKKRSLYLEEVKEELKQLSFEESIWVVKRTKWEEEMKTKKTSSLLYIFLLLPFQLFLSDSTPFILLIIPEFVVLLELAVMMVREEKLDMELKIEK